MAIIKDDKKPDNNQLKLVINNGDLEALNKIVKKFSFKNEESVFRYALAVLSVADTAKMEIEKIGGKTTVKPSPDLIKQEKEENQNAK